MVRFKIYLQEIKKATYKEYLNATKNYYDDDDFMELIIQGDDVAKHLTGNSNLKTEKTDSGNVIIRYAEGNNNIVILGMISKKGRMVREDLIDMKEWLGKLKQKMKDGFYLYSSFNENSRPFFDKIKKDLTAEGYIVKEKEISPKITFKDNTWRTVLVTTEKK